MAKSGEFCFPFQKETWKKERKKETFQRLKSALGDIMKVLESLIYKRLPPESLKAVAVTELGNKGVTI